MRAIAAAALLIACTGCAVSPVAPDPMAVWADKHAHDVCLYFTDLGGILMPLDSDWWSQVSRGRAQVMPISFCNPAE